MDEKLIESKDGLWPTTGPIEAAQGPDGAVLGAKQQLVWDASSPVRVSYTPCLIYVEGIKTDEVVKFKFINTKNAKPLARTHTLPLNDLDITHPKYSSTLPDTEDLDDGLKIAILMVRETGLNEKKGQSQPVFPTAAPAAAPVGAAALTYQDVLDDLHQSEAQGKWPRGSEGPPQIFVTLLSAIALTPGIQGVLPRRLFREILDALSTVPGAPLPIAIDPPSKRRAKAPAKRKAKPKKRQPGDQP